MLCIKTNSTDAYFNLAAEEYFLKNFDRDIFMVWQNANAVIVGFNQITQNEIDRDIAKAKKIQVVRRLTGGGAVYHDMGNINYTFIRRKDAGHFNDFPYFAKPLTDFLNTLGVEAVFSGKNDILIDGKKCCGTAQTIHDDDVLFHGTLLVETDFSVLSSVLKPDYSKLKRHAIKSVVSRVVNLTEFLPFVTAPKMFERIYEYFAKDGEEYEMTESDIKAVDKLRESKYTKDSWNYGEGEQ